VHDAALVRVVHGIARLPEQVDALADPEAVPVGVVGNRHAALDEFECDPGHAVLFDALAGLRDRPWQLVCVGSAERDAQTAAALREQIETLGLTGRIHMLGELSGEECDRRYAEANVFVLASFMEGYGMALAEALARGLPVLSTSAGAIPHTVPASAGILVPPGDSAALAGALAEIMDDSDRLEALSHGARRARERLPDWNEACARFAAELRELA